jgi:hypothetical protein
LYRKPLIPAVNFFCLPASWSEEKRQSSALERFPCSKTPQFRLILQMQLTIINYSQQALMVGPVLISTVNSPSFCIPFIHALALGGERSAEKQREEKNSKHSRLVIVSHD